jgi:hypothetical protein
VADGEALAEVERRVSQNVPLSYGGVTIYPASCQDAGHGKIAANFHVAHDPGKSCKKVGGWSLFFGIVVIVAIRFYLPSDVRRASPTNDTSASLPASL